MYMAPEQFNGSRVDEKVGSWQPHFAAPCLLQLLGQRRAARLQFCNHFKTTTLSAAAPALVASPAAAIPQALSFHNSSPLPASVTVCVSAKKLVVQTLSSPLAQTHPFSLAPTLAAGGCVCAGHHPERVLHAQAALEGLTTLLPNHSQGECWAAAGAAAGAAAAAGFWWGVVAAHQAWDCDRSVIDCYTCFPCCAFLTDFRLPPHHPYHPHHRPVAGGHQRRAALA